MREVYAPRFLGWPRRAKHSGAAARRVAAHVHWNMGHELIPQLCLRPRLVSVAVGLQQSEKHARVGHLPCPREGERRFAAPTRVGTYSHGARRICQFPAAPPTCPSLAPPRSTVSMCSYNLHLPSRFVEEAPPEHAHRIWLLVWVTVRVKTFP